MHTLVIQLGRLGDVIQTTPLVRELAGTTAGDRVDLLLLHPNQAAILGMPGLATTRLLGEDLKSLDDQIAAGFTQRRIPAQAEELREGLCLPHYDRVINSSHAALGCWLTAEISADQREGGVINREGECLYYGAAQTYRVAMVGFREQSWFNIVDLMRCAARSGGATGKGTAGQGGGNAGTPPGATLYANAAAFLPFALPLGRTIALNVGASEKARQWPAGHFARLAEGLAAQGFAPILVGAPSDLEACKQVQAASLVELPSFAGKTSIPEMALLLAKSELLVSADTGAAHMGAAVGTKVVGLFGAAAYFAETAPWGRGHSVLQSRLGATMAALTPDTALAAILHRAGRLDHSDLQRQLADSGQAAWETDFLCADSDPLGGLCYRPLHRPSSPVEDLFTRALRHVFALEFCGGRGRVSLDESADASALGAIDSPDFAERVLELTRNTDSLASILEQMREDAAACAEMCALGDAGVGPIASKLMRALDRLRSLVENVPWAMCRPVVHYLDWRLRMMPKLPPGDTFSFHAKECLTAANLLRGAKALVHGVLDRDDATKALGARLTKSAAWNRSLARVAV